MSNEQTNWRPSTRRYGYLDGDLLVYSGAAKFNDSADFQPIADYLDNEILYIADVLALDDWRIFVTAGGNFRKEVYPEYKANRKGEKPKWLGECYRYLYQDWGAKAERTYEADDLLGIALTCDPDAILISYDKDLDQIPGWHYNWRKKQMYYITPEEGYRFLLLQCLMGDRTDNIPGIHGIGPKKAEKLLEPQTLERVFELYKEHGLDYNTFQQFYKCSKILTTHDQSCPELEQFKENNNND